MKPDRITSSSWGNAIPKKGLLVLLLAVTVVSEGYAQRKRTTHRRTRKPAATQTQRATNPNGNNVVNPATGNMVTVPATVTPSESAATPNGGSLRPNNGLGIMGDTIKPSLRNNGAVEKNLIKDRTPLAYQYIREDDVFWERRLWEEIDIREKLNLPFRYNVQDDNGDQRFIMILINAIRKGEVTAFNPIDDRFTTPMTAQEVIDQLQGAPQTITVQNPLTGKDTTEVIRNDFDANSVVRFRLKEDWIFDKQTSTLYARIIGIAPEKAITNPDGSIRDYAPMFWLYYPDLRPVLARYDVYNPHNFHSTMSWEDLFELRMFSAYVIKEDNAFDRSLKDLYPNDGVRRLLKGQDVKNAIFDHEQDMWSY